MNAFKSITRKFEDKRVKQIAALVVILITAGTFTYFFLKHPAYLSSIKHISKVTLLELMLLEVLLLVVLARVYSITIRLCGVKIPMKENLLLTSYSTLINFFGPLQSGPGFRAIYLKTKHGIRYREYVFASLIYYAFFAIISATFLSFGALVWWQILLLMLVVIGIVVAILFLYRKRAIRNSEKLHISTNPWIIIELGLATLVQMLVISLIYFLELHVANHHISFRQALIYTGAANFAVFVSFTPGAIGLRESFLLLSRRLHHISTSVVLTASVIDRGIYIIFLGLLFIVILITHAQKKLNFKLQSKGKISV